MKQTNQVSPVSPALEELIQMDKSSRRVHLGATRIRAVRSGGHTSTIKGRGMAFEESRPYQPGDDMRTFDWIVTARTGKPHTKVFSEEKERPVVFWLDFRQSMFFATRGQFKSALSARMTAALAWAAHHSRDRVGALLFNENKHVELRPAGGHKPVLRLLNQLHQFSRFDKTQYHAADIETEQTALGNALLRLRKVVHPGSLILMMSDFRHLTDTHEKHIVELSRHNQLSMFRFYDGFERELPSNGLYPVKNNERLFTLNSNDTSMKARYTNYYDQQQSRIQDLAQLCRASLSEVSTETILSDWLQDTYGRKS